MQDFLEGVIAKVTGFEVAIVGVEGQELRALGMSKFLSVDRLHLKSIGCWGRIIVCGYSIELYDPRWKRKESNVNLNFEKSPPTGGSS